LADATGIPESSFPRPRTDRDSDVSQSGLTHDVVGLSPPPPPPLLLLLLLLRGGGSRRLTWRGGGRGDHGGGAAKAEANAEDGIAPAAVDYW
jgi:hypothetical protein